MRRVLRVLATPRWVGWTLLAVVAVIVCGGMAYWQLGRAESPTGSLLNAGYALQWPLFGVFFAALWWRMLHTEAHQLAIVRGEIPDDTDDADDAGTAVTAHGATAPAHDTTTPDAAPVVGTPTGTGRRRIPELPEPGSPFTPRPAGVLPGDGQGAPLRGRARTDYNAMLAALARSDANAADENR